MGSIPPMSSPSPSTSPVALSRVVLVVLLTDFICDNLLNSKNLVSEPALLPRLPFIAPTALLLQFLSSGMVYVLLFPKRRHLILGLSLGFAFFFVACNTIAANWLPFKTLPNLIGAGLLMSGALLYYCQLLWSSYVKRQQALYRNYTILQDAGFWMTSGVLTYFGCSLAVLAYTAADAATLSAEERTRYWLYFEGGSALKLAYFLIALHLLRKIKKQPEERED